MVRVNFEVGENKKERWEKYAQEQFGGNLSQLIRFSVDREIESEDYSGEQNNLEELSTLLTRLDEIDQDIDSMGGQLSGLESKVEKDRRVTQLADYLYDLLPDARPGSDAWQYELQQLEIGASREDGGKRELDKWRGTIQSLSNVVDESEYLVKEALTQLTRETGLVKSTQYGGEKRYWRDD